MLKYNFKMSKDTDLVQEIKCDSIYMSPDLTFISGITSNEYGLVDNQPIFIREGESNDYKEYKIQTFPQTERGYIIFPNFSKVLALFTFLGFKTSHLLSLPESCIIKQLTFLYFDFISS